MQLKKSIDIEPIGTANIVENLPIQHRRNIVVCSQPGSRKYDELDAHQPELPPLHRLIDQGLRLCGIQLVRAEQRTVHVVDAHRAMVGTAYAPEERSVSGCGGVIDIHVLLRGIANNLNQFGLVSRSGRRHLVLRQRKTGKYQDGEDYMRSDQR